MAEQFALQVLVLAEHLRPALDLLEEDEDDPGRLQRLYQVDHAVTRMRRAGRDLRIIAGGGDDELTGYTTSLVDVIRVAESSIERYTQVSIGTVAELAVVGYASDDVASLLAALMDNATRYSPSTVTISGHLLADGGVMFRIEDSGIGMEPARLARVNAALSGPVRDVDEWTGRHTGFPIVHRLAHKHGIKIRLAGRSPSSAGMHSGTIAMVIVPPEILCEIPAPAPSAPHGPDGAGRAPQRTGAHLAMARRPSLPGPSLAASAHRPASLPVQTLPESVPASSGAGQELPHRRRMSLREAGSAGAPPPATAEEQPDVRDPGASGRSFAADLSAFTGGDLEARRESTGPASGSDDNPEEQVP
ncbi:MAG TPA: ATP-binding protein [Streptosporangiaceae bacterium]